MVSHEEVEQQKKLPRVGDTVRSKKYGTLWRVMEKRRCGSTPPTIQLLEIHDWFRLFTSATGKSGREGHRV